MKFSGVLSGKKESGEELAGLAGWCLRYFVAVMSRLVELRDTRTGLSWKAEGGKEVLWADSVTALTNRILQELWFAK